MSPAPAREVAWAELLAHPGVREPVHLGSSFGFMAFHAGVEGGTLEVAAAAAAAAGASWYAVTQPVDLRWHVASADVDPASSAPLAGFLSHVEVVVAIHGWGRLRRPRDILVGGANRRLAEHVAVCLREATDEFDVIDDLDAIPARLRGLHPANPCNRPAGGGVQLELPPAARGASWRPADIGLPCRPAPAIVDGLAAAAASWAPALLQPTSNVPPDLQ